MIITVDRKQLVVKTADGGIVLMTMHGQQMTFPSNAVVTATADDAFMASSSWVTHGVIDTPEQEQ